jgi:hypothetical protein
VTQDVNACKVCVLSVQYLTEFVTLKLVGTLERSLGEILRLLPDGGDGKCDQRVQIWFFWREIQPQWKLKKNAMELNLNFEKKVA